MTNEMESPGLAQPKRNRYVPAIILGSLILVILASTLLFRAAVSGEVDLPGLLGTKNNGVLIKPPQPIAELPLRTGDGSPFDYAKQPKLWSIVIPVNGHCDAQCEQTLYQTRQIHIALGKHTERARRYLLTSQFPLDAQFENLLQQHPNLVVLSASAADYANYFARMNLNPAENHQYLLVDPNGWLMMYYRPDHDYKAVIKDLKFLISNSSEEGS
jgi:hypothetical protein